VLPANVGVESCSGNLKLLREGAIPVCDGWDILQEYEARYPGILMRKPTGSPSGGELTPDLDGEPEPEAKPAGKKDIDKPKAKAYIDLKDIMETLSRDEQTLAVLLQSGPMHIDVIVDQAQMAAGRALASLTLLEVKGIVQRPSARMYELKQKEN
jgi:predicted Rossmann fold nucleotide-binding protein DprA/Smf involved in DNA uptake